MSLKHRSGLDYVLSLAGHLTPAEKTRVASELLELANQEPGEDVRPTLDVNAIPAYQRAALTWRLRDILAAPCDLDAAYGLRGGVLALICELEGASAESVAPLLLIDGGRS